MATITTAVPIYRDNFVPRASEVYSSLLKEVAWVEVQARRKEAFMAHVPSTYQYIERADAPVYSSTAYHTLVGIIEKQINEAFNCRMDLCFLNYYADQHQALGWHSDDGSIIDQTQPIVVVSLGEVRQIWTRPIGFKGEIPKESKYSLGDGSVFIMPPGFQNAFQHKIPKGDREMGGRISLTYRSRKP